MRFTPSLLVAVAGLAAFTSVACHKDEQHAAGTVPAAQNVIQGTVLEVLPASPYTYIRLKTIQGEAWAAVPAADLKVGANVTVLVQVRMTAFQSTTLKRTFDSLAMGTLAGDPASATAAAVAAQVTAPLPVVEKVAKAAGADAYSISEIYAQKTQLKDQKVLIKAKVMKVMGGIMGKTWMHLCDGTGDAKNSFDLPVTTLGTAKVGDIVTVQGVLHLDRDFGSGYTYPIIVEDARIIR